MKRSDWMSGAKTLAAMTALTCATLMASTAAQADIYDYTFSANGTGSSFSGTFQATITGFGGNPSSGAIPVTNGMGTFGAIPQFGDPGNTISSVNGNINFSNGSATFLARVTATNGLVTSAAAQGTVSGTSTAFSFGNSSTGLFSAVFSAPSGGGSGGAPTPEVNAGLGVLIAGASFAFLRRKRGAQNEMTAA